MSKDDFIAKQDQDWNEIGSDESDEENEDNYNTALSQNDHKRLLTLTKQIKERFDFLESDEIRTAILECDFDQDRITKYLEKYEIDDKFKGIDAYEWKVVEEKPFVNKKKGKGNKRQNQREQSDNYQQNFYYGQENYQNYYEPYTEHYQDQKESTNEGEGE